MADLDSKLMSEKTVSYVSDSDGEEINDDILAEHAAKGQYNDLSHTSGPQTGPKGVLEDYHQYKEICKLEDMLAIKENIALHKKTAFTADPNKHPDLEKKEDDSDNEFDFEDDEFLKEYHNKRLAQLRNEMEQKITQQLPQFGSLFHLSSGTELLDVIEKEDKNTIIIIHLYDPNIPACVTMNKSLECLAGQYKFVKFCKLLAASAGLSLTFKLNALPALQVYKNRLLIGNYIKMQEQLDKIFYTADVENFLIESDVLTSMQGGCKNFDDYDVVDDEDE